MGYAKERKKLEKLSEKITGLGHYDGKNLEIITDLFEQYSHTIRILKNKDPEHFNELYLNELQEIKEQKKALKLTTDEGERDSLFLTYKESLSNALTKTIQVISEIK